MQGRVGMCFARIATSSKEEEADITQTHQVRPTTTTSGMRISCAHLLLPDADYLHMTMLARDGAEHCTMMRFGRSLARVFYARHLFQRKRGYFSGSSPRSGAAGWCVLVYDDGANDGHQRQKRNWCEPKQHHVCVGLYRAIVQCCQVLHKSITVVRSRRVHL